MSELAAVSAAKSVLGASGSTELTIRNIFRFTEAWANAAAIAGTTALAEQPACRVKQKCRLVGVSFVTAAAVTANGTNFFTLLLDKRPVSAPGTPVNLITFAADTPTTDDIAAFTEKAIYPAAPGTDFNLAEGDVLTAEVTKTGGTGLAFPACTVTFIFEARD